MPGYIPGKIKNSSEIARRTAYLVPVKPYAFVRFVAPPIRLEGGEGKEKKKGRFLGNLSLHDRYLENKSSNSLLR